TRVPRALDMRPKSAPHQAAAALAAKQPTIAVRDEILAFFARRLCAPPRIRTISPRALEVLLHRLEIAALPSAVAVAGVTVGHIAVPHRDRGAARRRLQQHLDLRIRIGGGEFGGSPRLDDPPARLELEIPSRNVAVPYCERGALLCGDLRFL